MLTFNYTLTCGSEARTTELRRSNPQGWLPDAVRATFPDLAARRADDLRIQLEARIELEAVDGLKQIRRAVSTDEPSDLLIRLTQTRA